MPAWLEKWAALVCEYLEQEQASLCSDLLKHPLGIYTEATASAGATTWLAAWEPGWGVDGVQLGERDLSNSGKYKPSDLLFALGTPYWDNQVGREVLWCHPGPTLLLQALWSSMPVAGVGSHRSPTPPLAPYRGERSDRQSTPEHRDHAG